MTINKILTEVNGYELNLEHYSCLTILRKTVKVHCLGFGILFFRILQNRVFNVLGLGVSFLDINEYLILIIAFSALCRGALKKTSCFSIISLL